MKGLKGDPGPDPDRSPATAGGPGRIDRFVKLPMGVD